MTLHCVSILSLQDGDGNFYHRQNDVD